MLRICGICDSSQSDLEVDGEVLVECATCAETVCTASCAKMVTDENGNDVYECSECASRTAWRKAVYA